MVINWLIGGLEHEWMIFPWGKITPTDEVHHFSEGLVETTNHHQPVIESQHWEEIMGKYGQKKTEQIWKDDVLQAMGTSSFFSVFFREKPSNGLGHGFHSSVANKKK